MKQLGAIGFGLVWGWFMIIRDEVSLRRPRTLLILAIFTLIMAAEVYWLAELQALPFFLIALGASTFAHWQWKRELRKRYWFRS